MLDREYEQYLQECHCSAIKNNSTGFLWAITAAIIIIPALIYAARI